MFEPLNFQSEMCTDQPDRRRVGLQQLGSEASLDLDRPPEIAKRTASRSARQKDRLLCNLPCCVPKEFKEPQESKGNDNVPERHTTVALVR